MSTPNFSFFLEGKPISKARPRFNGQTRAAYSTQKAAEMALKFEIGSLMRDKGVLRACDQSLRVEMTFHMDFPRSFNTSQKKAFSGYPCCKRPDLDNLVKFYWDVMNKIVYDDDAQICELYAKKVYSSTPGVDIAIKSLEKGEHLNEIHDGDTSG